MPFVIAVDGPAASGKGTVSKGLAAYYGLPYLDTGTLYRAVGAALVAQNRDPADPLVAEAAALSLNPADIDPDPIRSGILGEATSQAAQHPGVRRALLAMQKDFAGRAGGAVLDGRDIGTVIAPQAPAKLFVTAAPDIRARRRWLQLNGQGESVSVEDVLADILKRDARDSGRSDAPLVQAADAVLLDTSDLSIEEAADAARRIVEAARKSWEQSRL